MSLLSRAIADINKKHKTELIQRGTETVYVDKIPFSSPRANYLTYGGIPIGKATEFFGSEGGGKTTSALDITAQAQRKAKAEYQQKLDDIKTELSKLGDKSSKADIEKLKRLQESFDALRESGERKVVYIDAENTLDVAWAKKLGVDTDALILVRPQDQTAEQVLQIMLDLIDTGEVSLMVLDSVPMLVSQTLYEESLEKKSYAGIAGAVTEFCRKVSPKISKYRTALLLINQVRENLDNPYDQFKTAGGKALKHLYALRLYFRRGSFIDENYNELPNRTETPSGNLVDITLVKSKVCRPDRRVGQYTLNYYSGIDSLSDTVFMAVKYGLIIQAGAWYEVASNGAKYQGKAKLSEYLKSNPDVYQTIYDAVYSEVTKDTE
jgi:recombination protein RecA